MKFKVKRGDEVEVIAGSSKGRKGKVLNVLKKKAKVLIEGINMKVKHAKKSEKHPEGGKIEMEAPIHYSNVKKVVK